MAKNSAEGNRTRTARYRAALAERGIRPVQVIAPESAHALLRQAAGLMTREQDPLDSRAALRQAGGINEAGKASNPEPGGQELAVELNAAKIAEATARTELAGAEDRARALATELEEAQNAGHRAEQAKAAETVAALAQAETAEQEREEVARELAAVRVEAEAAQGRERVAQEAADALRGELAGIRGRGGWRGALLRLAGVRT